MTDTFSTMPRVSVRIQARDEGGWSVTMGFNNTHIELQPNPMEQGTDLQAALARALMALDRPCSLDVYMPMPADVEPFNSASLDAWRDSCEEGLRAQMSRHGIQFLWN